MGLEQELDRHYRLLRMWLIPPTHCSVIGDPNHGADAELFDVLPSLEIIAFFFVSVDRVNLAECRHRGFRVTNTPDVLTDAVADLPSGSPSQCCVGPVVSAASTNAQCLPSA